MSRLNIEHGGDERRSLAHRKLYLSREPSVAVNDRVVLQQHAADYLGRDEPITYLEFGVAAGGSFQGAVRQFVHPSSLFVGFDSFVGLSEDWLVHPRGTFSNDGKVPLIQDSRVRFVQGYFQNTLNESLVWLRDHLKGRVLIHFDCDLYYSTLFVLSSLWAHCSEYHFIMDDFMQDDIVALHDFSLAYPVEIEFLARADASYPKQVFGRMVRTKLSF
jgi:hypothetical protein